MQKTFKLQILFALFVALLVGVNLIGGKIVEIFGISVSVGIFMMPVLFLITDIVEEVYSKKLAYQFVLSSVIALVVILGFTLLFVSLEPHARFAEKNPAYVETFSQSLRIIIASIIAFLISQTHDVWFFNYLKKKTKGKALWLRNNASTIISQAIDTLVFMFIAFYMITPKFDAMFILSLTIPYYLFKISFAALDTPFVYLGVRWFRGKKKTGDN